MPNQINKDIVNKLKAKAEKAKAIIFADVKGMTSNSSNDLRAKMKENDADVAIAKNTLLQIALKEAKVDTSKTEDIFKGSTAAIFSYGDIVSPLKAVFEFAKKLELPKIKGGILDGKFATAFEIETLSKLPSKEILVAQVLSTMKSPLNGIVNVLSGSQKKFVYALSAIAKKKEVQ